MPTITFSFNDLQNLVGKKFTIEKFKEYIVSAKAEFEKQENDEISVKYNDTNQPYLWSVEGLARFLKNFLELNKGMPSIKLEKSFCEVLVDKNVENVRPFITAFVAKGERIDDYLLKQLIQLQEKICDNFGRRRQKIAIGLYPSKKINFPITYKAVKPEDVSFIPLEFEKSLNLKQILEYHSKGKEYSWILKDFKNYPLLIDSKNKVLSFPPIINSNDLGKLSVGDDELFFEATGNDLKSLMLSCNIFAYALSDRGFKIFPATIRYKSKNVSTPDLYVESVRMSSQDIKNILGLDLKDSEIKKLLEKAQYSFKNFLVEIPPYRQDIMHPVDIVEDVAIMYGYDKIRPEELKTQTYGATFELTKFVNNCREILVGNNFQEIWSQILYNKKSLYDKMNIKDFGTIEIEEFMSENYSVVRSWLLPIVIEVLSENKSKEFPQRIFEQGLICKNINGNPIEEEHLAFAISHTSSDYTEVKQTVDLLLRLSGFEYFIKECVHYSFIPGRVGEIFVKNKSIGYIGEIHPQVLNNWGIEMPTAGVELNLTELFNLKK